MQAEKINEAIKEVMINSEKTRDDTLKVLSTTNSDQKKVASPKFQNEEENKASLVDNPNSLQRGRGNQSSNNSGNNRLFTFALKDQ